MNNELNDPEELFDLPATYCCSYVGARIDRALIGNIDNYQQYAEVPHQPFIASGKDIFELPFLSKNWNDYNFEFLDPESGPNFESVRLKLCLN